MKRVLTVISIFLISAFGAYSQEENNDQPAPSNSSTDIRLMPSESDWGMTFNLTGLINNIQLEGNKNEIGQEILFFKKYLKDDLALRLGFGLNTVNNQTTRKDSNRQIPAFIEYDSTYTRNDVSISLGIEKHFEGWRRLDPYLGGELNMAFIGSQTSSWNRNIIETAGTTNIEGEYKLDGGTAIGVFGIAGFNFFIARQISLGAEYRFGYQYLKTGGAFSESIRITPPSGSSTNTFSKGTQEDKSSGFEVNSTANIIFSIFF